MKTDIQVGDAYRLEGQPFIVVITGVTDTHVEWAVKRGQFSLAAKDTIEGFRIREAKSFARGAIFEPATKPDDRQPNI